MYVLVLSSCIELTINGDVEKSTKFRRRRRPNKRKAFQHESDQSKLNALTIKFPASILERQCDWRSSPGILSIDNNTKHQYMMDTSKLKAQDKEDLWLYEHWFYGITNGIVIESGALDGISLSTSYFFESFANWTAIHIEGDPENFRRLQYNRPESINIHGALCKNSQILHYSNISISSVRGFVEFMAPAFLKKWHGRIFRNITSIDALPKVQCIPMRQILKLLHLTTVDLWVLDIEGAEEQALLGTDFQAVNIKTIAMECDVTDIERNDRKIKILEGQGYICELIQRNCMCRRSDFVTSSIPTSSSTSVTSAYST